MSHLKSGFAKVPYLRLFFLLIAFSTSVVIFLSMSQRRKHIKVLPSLDPTPGKTHVLVFAGYRTGSSFTASLLSVNKKIFYIFEPLIYVVDAKARNTELGKQIQASSTAYLWRFFTCQFVDVLAEAKVLHKNLRNESFWKKWHSRVFRNLKKTHNFLPENETGLLQAEKICKTYDVVAIKTIRVDYFKTIINLLAINVKVIHLVRDPRGVVQSVGNLGFTKLWCDHVKANTETQLDMQAGADTSALMEKNYRLLRYEDLTINTTSIAHKIYDFLRLPLPETVLELIEAKPQVNIWQGPLKSRTNNGSSVIKWVDKLSHKVAMQIESACKSVMTMYGYERLKRKFVKGRVTLNTFLRNISSELKYIMHP